MGGGGLHVVLKHLSPVFRATISVLYYTCWAKNWLDITKQ